MYSKDEIARESEKYRLAVVPIEMRNQSADIQ
jgi:hypothetical protein